MSGYKNFAIVGAGVTGRFIVRQLSKDKVAGTIDQVIVLTRQVRSVSACELSVYLPRATTAGIQDHH
jgi:predicted dinucleotide-utilizing enzyme